MTATVLPKPYTKGIGIRKNSIDLSLMKSIITIQRFVAPLALLILVVSCTKKPMDEPVNQNDLFVLPKTVKLNTTAGFSINPLIIRIRRD